MISLQDKLWLPESISMQKRAVRLAVGVVVGFVVATILVLVSSGNLVPSWVANTILSVMTYSGFAFVILGYFYKRNGKKPFAADFMLGFGVGLILIYYVEAGLDIIPNF